jgi:hypothetical protein
MGVCAWNVPTPRPERWDAGTLGGFLRLGYTCIRDKDGDSASHR